MRIEGQTREKETGEFIQSNSNKILTEVKADNRQIEKEEPKNLKLKIDGFLMYGFCSSSQIDKIYNELKKPQDKRLYILGIDFSRVKSVEVIKE